MGETGLSVQEVAEINGDHRLVHLLDSARVVAHITALEAELARLKPSGQVAEDVAVAASLLSGAIDGVGDGPRYDRLAAAISLLSTKAQGYEAAMLAWDDAASVSAAIAQRTGPLSANERRDEMRPPTPGERLLQKYWEMYRRVEKERDAAVADNAALNGLLGEWHEWATGSGAMETSLDPLFARSCEIRARAHPGTALLEEHRKALTRARNEGWRRCPPTSEP